MPPATITRARSHSSRDVRELQVVSKRHPCCRNTDDIPIAAQQFALERSLRWLATAIGIENLGLDAGSRQHARKPPDSQRRRKKSVFAAVWIVRSDQQHLRRKPSVIHF